MDKIRRSTLIRGEVYEHTENPGPLNERSVNFVQCEPMLRHCEVTLTNGKKFDIPWGLIHEVWQEHVDG